MEKLIKNKKIKIILKIFYLWRLLAGVGHDAVVGVCPACWGIDETPLPGDDTPPETDDSPVFGSGFNFLKAPSAKI